MLDAGQSTDPAGAPAGGVTGVSAPVVTLGQCVPPVIVVKVPPLWRTIELRMKLLLKKSWRVTAGPRKVSAKLHSLSPLPSPTTWVPSLPLHIPQCAVVVGCGCGEPVDPVSLLTFQV